MSEGPAPGLELDAPPFVNRYLLPTERLVVAVRRHPAQLIEPVGSVVLTLALVLWLESSLPPGFPLLLDAAWFGWALVVSRGLWRLLEWYNDWFLITDRRMLLTYGLVTRKVAMMPMTKVTDMSYNRSPMGRLLGYGEFVMESAGQDQALRSVGWLPSPDALYGRICREIFGTDDKPEVIIRPERRGRDRDRPEAD